MAFTLNSVIKIGAYTFHGGINDLNIKSSVHSIMETGTLQIPGLGRVVSKSNTANLPSSSVQTAKLFKEGDPVNIDLGYNGDLRNEFKGFVRRVNINTPLSIDLEGYAWQLRNSNILASWKNVTLREVLERIIKGTDITLSDKIPDVDLAGYSIPNRSGLAVLEHLKEKFRLTIYFDGNELYAGLQEIVIRGSVKYSLGYNVVRNNELKQRLASDNLVRVKITVKDKKTGKHTLYESGDKNGTVKEIKIPYIRDAQFLKNLANSELKKVKYNGYEGKITGFLQPYCKPAWKCILLDKQYQGARAGNYFISSVEVRYGINGARRIIEISYRLDTE